MPFLIIKREQKTRSIKKKNHKKIHSQLIITFDMPVSFSSATFPNKKSKRIDIKSSNASSKLPTT